MEMRTKHQIGGRGIFRYCQRIIRFSHQTNMLPLLHVAASHSNGLETNSYMSGSLIDLDANKEARMRVLIVIQSSAELLD